MLYNLFAAIIVSEEEDWREAEGEKECHLPLRVFERVTSWLTSIGNRSSSASNGSYCTAEEGRAKLPINATCIKDLQQCGGRVTPSHCHPDGTQRYYTEQTGKYISDVTKMTKYVKMTAAPEVQAKPLRHLRPPQLNITITPAARTL